MKKILFFILVIFTGCSSASETSADAFDKMSSVFIGHPDKAQIKKLISGIEEKYSLPKTDEEADKIGSMVIDLSMASKVGVTEMDILQHIYQKGSPVISLPDQAAASATYLEINKK